jgi:hypothetical protein
LLSSLSSFILKNGAKVRVFYQITKNLANFFSIFVADGDENRILGEKRNETTRQNGQNALLTTSGLAQRRQ